MTRKVSTSETATSRRPRRRRGYHRTGATPPPAGQSRGRKDLSVDENGDPLLTVAEAGERLGKGERYARRLIAERRITYVKYGTARCSPVRIPERALEAWIAAHRVEAPE